MVVRIQNFKTIVLGLTCRFVHKRQRKKIKKLTTFALFGWKFRFIKRLKVICEKFYFLSAENETNDKKNYGLVTHA